MALQATSRNPNEERSAAGIRIGMTGPVSAFGGPIGHAHGGFYKKLRRWAEFASAKSQVASHAERED